MDYIVNESVLDIIPLLYELKGRISLSCIKVFEFRSELDGIDYVGGMYVTRYK